MVRVVLYGTVRVQKLELCYQKCLTGKIYEHTSSYFSFRNHFFRVKEEEE